MGEEVYRWVLFFVDINVKFCTPLINAICPKGGT